MLFDTLCQSFQHQSAHHRINKRFACCGQKLVIFTHSPIASNLGNRSLDYPTAFENCKARHRRRLDIQQITPPFARSLDDPNHGLFRKTSGRGFSLFFAWQQNFRRRLLLFKYPPMDFLIDSMPIMLASGTRSNRASIAPEIAKCGFSAVKQTHFHGVCLHLIAEKKTAALPLPTKIWLKEGNVHDLTACGKSVMNCLPESICSAIKPTRTNSSKRNSENAGFNCSHRLKSRKERNFPTTKSNTIGRFQGFASRSKVFSNG